MDVTQALKDAENALRDFIPYILIPKYGKEWYDHCGINSERVKKWFERKAEDSKRIGVKDSLRYLVTGEKWMFCCPF